MRRTASSNGPGTGATPRTTSQRSGRGIRLSRARIRTARIARFARRISLRDGRLLLAQVADQAAGDDDLALARQEVVRQRDHADAIDLDLELVVPLRDRVQAAHAPGLAELGLVVIGLVLEEEGHDALGDQIPPV